MDPQRTAQGTNKDALVRVSQDRSIFQQCSASDVSIVALGPTHVYPDHSLNLPGILLLPYLKAQHKASGSSSGGTHL